MCGVVGYVGQRPAREALLAGLERLEYRGYDSAGLSVLRNGQVETLRAVGNLSALREKVRGGSDRASGTIGIAHTRWATHGGVCEANAHPHTDTAGRVHVVVNGIVENYVSLRGPLAANGAVFASATDAEVIAHLVAAELNGGGLVEAVRRACAQLSGHYAFVALTAEHPDMLVGARHECPLLVGCGDGERYLASATPAFLRHARRAQLIEDGEVVAIQADRAQFFTARGRAVRRRVAQLDGDVEVAEKGGYETFMLKEIHEQPEAIAATTAGIVHDGGLDLPSLGAIDDEVLARCRRVVLVGCGTSYHAALMSRYLLESWLRIPVEVDIASEYRYRAPVVGPDDLVIGITQSGETADTLAAMRLGRHHGAKVLAITNVVDSRATRDSDGVLLTRAGIEIGVAATKTFMAQVVAFYLLGLRMAELRGVLEPERTRALIAAIRRLPESIADVLGGATSAAVERIAARHHGKDFFLYLGRHLGLATALEGALKLKEIAYVATDAYAAGEMKHGPLALVTEGTPVIVIATDSPVLDKTVSNMQQVRARGAHVIAVGTEYSGAISEHADDVLAVPATDWMIQPLLAVVPLQLLAYRIARLRGLNVDQPRNLAKTVTVE